MKISLKWINEFVDVAEFFQAPEKLGDLLTSAGLEVEDIQDGASQFANVVVGEILELGRHPDADKLTLCQVRVSEDGSQPIVCGAKNHSAGDKVVVALPGAVLPGDFAIKKSKIRGVESLGMLCSESELDLADEADGIIILPTDAPVGKPFAEYQGLDDVIFELKVTPNRADCLSHLGLARELASLLERELKIPKNLDKLPADGCSQSEVAVDIQDIQRCPRFTGRYFKAVQVKPSPAWLKRRLESLGINSINNVVDITNLVMLEYGQPMHAYDARHIQDRKLQVAGANPGETFVTFDGTELKLSPDDLTIRDANRCIGLAGIIGGQNSGVSEDTTEVFLECAYFDPAAIRRTSRRFGIQTEACYRFTRGVDPSAVLAASDRATELFVELADATALANPWDIYPHPISRAPIEMESGLPSQRLGYEVSEEKVVEVLRMLGCEVKSESGRIQVSPPLYRWDLEQPMDLVEEVGRVIGYDQIPETLPSFDFEPTPHVKSYVDEKELGSVLSGMGFLQAVNYSFVGGDFQTSILGDSDWSQWGLGLGPSAVKILNPLNEELDVMRCSLLPWVLRNLSFNFNHGNRMGRAYEVGSVFGSQDGEYKQKDHLAFVEWGEPKDIWSELRANAVMRLKSRIEEMLGRLGVQSWSWESIDQVPGILHPGQSCCLRLEGRVVGVLGAVHPQWLQGEKVRVSAAVAEFQLDSIMKRHPRLSKFQSISKFPSMERDLAFVLPKDLQAAKVAAAIKKVAGKSLQGVEVVDLYEGDSVGPDSRSVTFRMKFQDFQKTLDDGQVNDLQNKVISHVEKQFSVSVR